ncbi:hypothetical protein SEVIR_9G083250v4 [Setaria viridis]
MRDGDGAEYTPVAVRGFADWGCLLCRCDPWPSAVTDWRRRPSHAGNVTESGGPGKTTALGLGRSRSGVVRVGRCCLDQGLESGERAGGVTPSRLRRNRRTASPNRVAARMRVAVGEGHREGARGLRWSWAGLLETMGGLTC